MIHAPLFRAVAIQLVSLLLVQISVNAFADPQNEPVKTVLAALAQGAIAAALSRLFRLATWWLAIQAVFPIALVATLSLHLPPNIFLAVFIVLVALYWSTFRTQVPFYPSGKAAARAVANRLPMDRAISFIDIGSGMGGLVLHLASLRRGDRFTGVEIAPLPWLISVLCRWKRRSNARFIRSDYECLNFGAYEVVFAYLSPVAMSAVWIKARNEMRAGTLFLSYEFEVPGVVPDIMDVPVGGGPTLYGWYM
ncbi:class I SAM-dependent methyltransferase [Herbaspirillum sp. GCM10030257]|uniref:class I SAM-dependent methyltransferase n=1 Tax=Herbaspirillum sp. GCM10030257 TaxID=3273393 RepID=UPI0036187F1D